MSYKDVSMYFFKKESEKQTAMKTVAKDVSETRHLNQSIHNPRGKHTQVSSF